MGSPRLPLVIVLCAAFLCGCGKEPPAAPKAAPPTVKPVVKPPAAKVAAAVAAAAAAPPSAFVYDPAGLRDPFEPFIKLAEKKPQGPPKVAVPRTPLQRYETDKLKLVGVVWGADGKARALIEDPQGKGYAVGVGTFVGDKGGKISRILPDRIVIEERFKDLFGEEKKNVANIMLHKSEGEVGP